MKVSAIVTIASALFAVAHGIPFEKRRFGNDGKPEVRDFEAAVRNLDSQAGSTGFFADLSGCIPVAVLGASGACAQQDVSDSVIGAMTAFGLDQSTINQITQMAVTYRQAERNSQEGTLTPECARPPKSKALNDLTQAQDPNAKGTPPVCNSVYMDLPACAFGTVIAQQAKIETALGANFDDAAEDNGKGCKAINPGRAALEGKGNGKGKEGDNGKGKEGDNGKGKGKEGDNGKGKGKEGDNGKGKGKEGDNGKGKGKEGDNGKGKEGGCDNVAFTDSVGGVPPPLISQNANGKFQVQGNAEFNNIENAHQRQCDVQKNQCFNKFNGGDRSFSGQDCEQQRTNCQAGDPILSGCANGDNGDNGKGKDGDNGKGKEGDNGKGKGKDGDNGKGKEGDNGKGKGKEGDNGKGKEGDNGKGKEGGCDNVAFTDSVGGVLPPLISQNANGKFQVQGNAEFDNIDNAHQRQCDVQKNQCFNKFNGGDRSFSGQDCEQQRTNCQAGDPILSGCA